MLLRFCQLTSGTPLLLIIAKRVSAGQVRLMPLQLPIKSVSMLSGLFQAPLVCQRLQPRTFVPKLCRGVTEFQGLLGKCCVAQTQHVSPTTMIIQPGFTTLVGQVVRTKSLLGLAYGSNSRGGTCMDLNFLIIIHFRKIPEGT